MRTPHWQIPGVTLYQGDVIDVLREMEPESVHTCVTSPPYWGLRDYGADGQLGLEATPEAYVERMVAVFREVRRVLRDDGTLWLNLGDSYTSQGGAHGGRNDNQLGVGARRVHAVGCGDQAARTPPDGLKPKDLVGIPWRVAFALQADGWWLRSDIIWSKPNPMPESVTDRPTKAHEYVFLMAKRERYYYDAKAIREPAEWARWGEQTIGKEYRAIKPVDMGSIDERRKEGRNKRSVWHVATAPYAEAHFATFPPDLIKPCILAGAPEGGVVLDPFVGSGTTAMVARDLGRQAIGIDLNAEYLGLAQRRIGGQVHMPV